MSLRIPEVPKISKKAINAIRKGVGENHHVCVMEELGMTQRMMNLFEERGIISLGDLMYRTKEDLLNLPNFGEKQLILLFSCLAKYHTL